MQQPVLYEDTETGGVSYQPDVYIRPDANLSVYVWLVLLGLPALLLFLIYFQAAK